MGTRTGGVARMRRRRGARGVVRVARRGSAEPGDSTGESVRGFPIRSEAKGRKVRLRCARKFLLEIGSSHVQYGTP